MPIVCTTAVQYMAVSTAEFEFRRTKRFHSTECIGPGRWGHECIHRYIMQRATLLRDILI